MTAMLCVTAFVGCGSSGGSSDAGSGGGKLADGLVRDKGNVMKIRLGMTYDEVVDLLGEPSETADSGKMNTRARWNFGDMTSFENLEVEPENGEYYNFEVYFPKEGANEGKIYVYYCFLAPCSESSWDAFSKWIKEQLAITEELKRDEFSTGIVESVNGYFRLGYEKRNNGKIEGDFAARNEAYK